MAGTQNTTPATAETLFCSEERKAALIEQYWELVEAIASGARIVRHASKEVTYRSQADMHGALAFLKDQMKHCGVTVPGERERKQRITLTRMAPSANPRTWPHDI